MYKHTHKPTLHTYTDIDFFFEIVTPHYYANMVTVCDRELSIQQIFREHLPYIGSALVTLQ